MANNVQFTDNSDEVKAELARKVALALKAMGEQAVTYAKKNITDAEAKVKNPLQRTGRLRNSVARAVKIDENAVYIGTNVDYAPYYEYGTGKYAENGKGRPGWWVFVPGSNYKSKNPGKIYTYEEAARIVASLRAKGIDAHMTQGMKPTHFLRDAVTKHQDHYKKIAKAEMKD